MKLGVASTSSLNENPAGGMRIELIDSSDFTTHAKPRRGCEKVKTRRASKRNNTSLLAFPAMLEAIRPVAPLATEGSATNIDKGVDVELVALSASKPRR